MDRGWRPASTLLILCCGVQHGVHFQPEGHLKIDPSDLFQEENSHAGVTSSGNRQPAVRRISAA